MLALKLGLSLESNARVDSGFDNKYSLTYDGVIDYLALSASADPLTPMEVSGSTGWSFSIWLKTGTSKNIFSKRIGGQSEYWLFVRSNGQPIFYLYDEANGGNITLNLNTSIADSNWHHLVFTWDGDPTGERKWYLDGDEEVSTTGGSGTFDGVQQTTAEFRMGYGEGSYSDFIQDEFSVFRKVLSSGEVTTLYNSGIPGKVTEISHCTGWWRNGDPSGASVFPTIADASANDNPGTMENMASSDIITDVPS
tara:strand:- start:320 stop:1075 length:756 start_codon:yes stop_codon:yes gene_type:complete